jgi:hypothetical protein
MIACGHPSMRTCVILHPSALILLPHCTTTSLRARRKYQFNLIQQSTKEYQSSAYKNVSHFHPVMDIIFGHSIQASDVVQSLSKQCNTQACWEAEGLKIVLECKTIGHDDEKE